MEEEKEQGPQGTHNTKQDASPCFAIAADDIGVVHVYAPRATAHGTQLDGPPQHHHR